MSLNAYLIPAAATCWDHLADAVQDVAWLDAWRCADVAQAVADAEADDFEQARGSYQRALLNGRERWSGGGMRGKARHFGANYKRSRDSLYGRIGGWLRTSRAHGGKVYLVQGLPCDSRLVDAALTLAEVVCGTEVCTVAAELLRDLGVDVYDLAADVLAVRNSRAKRVVHAAMTARGVVAAARTSAKLQDRIRAGHRRMLALRRWTAALDSVCRAIRCGSAARDDVFYGLGGPVAATLEVTA